MKPEGLLFDATWRRSTHLFHASTAETAPFLKRHYLGKAPAVVTCRLVIVNDALGAVGAVVYALPPRETARRYGGVTWELARLFIDDVIPTNAETWAIAASVRHIRRDHPGVDVLVSYADPSAGHEGGIYVAANWTRDGRTDDERRTPRVDYYVDGRKIGRRSHVPDGVTPERRPRISKPRFVYRIPSRRPVVAVPVAKWIGERIMAAQG